MKNKSKIITILIFVVIVAIALILYFIGNSKKAVVPIIIDQTQEPIPKENLLGNKDDLISFSIWPNTKVHGIVSYRGVIKGGYFFEANIGINILDMNKKVLKASNAVAKTDWMTAEPVSFEGNIDFTGLPTGPAYFEIHNDNASGLPEKDKSVLIPIIIENDNIQVPKLEQIPYTKLPSLIDSGKSYKCSIETLPVQKIAGQEMSSSSIIYIAQNKSYNVTNTKVDNKNSTWYSIIEDDFSYSWTLGSNNGFKYIESKAKHLDIFNKNSKNMSDMQCATWQADLSLFIPPSSVQFELVDLNKK